MTEYQGIILAEDQSIMEIDTVYFAKTQVEEYKGHIKAGKLPDGRVIVDSRVLESPVDRKSIDLINLEMAVKSCNLPSFERE